MSEMIERLAWRISRFRLEQDGVDVSKWNPLALGAAKQLALETHRELAVAVLEELREPTDAMLDAGDAAYSPPLPAIGGIWSAWDAMIRSAKGTP